MKVTNIRLSYPKNKEGKLKAFAKITLDDQLIISGIRLIVTKEKRFLQFPEKKIDNAVTEGSPVTVPLVHPIKSELRNHITEEVFAVYDEQATVEVDEDKE